MAGISDTKKLDKIFELIALVFTTAQLTGTDAVQEAQDCHAHLTEAMCHLIAPKCDRSTKQMTHLCREMCFDLVDACFDKVTSLLKIVSAMPERAIIRQDVLDINPNALAIVNQGCAYLPSRHDKTQPCFYKAVSCGKLPSPPEITVLQNVSLANERNVSVTYPVKFQVNYACKDKAYQLRGNSTVSCLFSGKWSAQPKCVAEASGPVFIVVIIFSLPATALLSLLLWYKCKSDMVGLPTRQRENDAFVCYDFDTDHAFVTETLLPNLEPQFKLFVHSRDFTPGIEILANIQEAIQKSNCAIILLSQAFINSDWCRHEFRYCSMESVSDPAYRLLVILMQPADQLNNLNRSCSIEDFIKSRTYLEKDDPDLWEKISRHLTRVKGEV